MQFMYDLSLGFKVNALWSKRILRVFKEFLKCFKMLIRKNINDAA